MSKNLYREKLDEAIEADTLPDLRRYWPMLPLKAKPMEEHFHYSRDAELNVTLTRKMQKLYLPDQPLVGKNNTGPILLSEGQEDYLNINAKSEREKSGSKREVSHLRLVAIMMQEKKWGKKVLGDILGPRRIFLDLINTADSYYQSSYKLAYFDNQVFIIEDRHQRNNGDKYSMCGPNFEAFATGRSIPAKDNSEKYNVAVLHDFPESDGLDGIKALITCDVDAVLELDDESLTNNVEFKAKGNLRYLGRAVLQCHIAGGSKLIVGRRDRDCYLREIVDYNTDPWRIEDKHWLRRVREVCTFIVQVARRHCADKDPLRPHEMWVSVDELGIVMRDAPPHRQDQDHDEIEVLPQWFIDHRHELALASKLSLLLINKQDSNKDAGEANPKPDPSERSKVKKQVFEEMQSKSPATKELEPLHPILHQSNSKTPTPEGSVPLEKSR